MNSNPNSHEPLVDSALIGRDLAAEHHLAGCPCCQQDREKIEQALQHFADVQRAQAHQPEHFWEEQTARIRAARAELRPRSPVRTALVPALAVLLVFALELVPRKQSQPLPPPQQAQLYSDHELLVQVERAVNNGTPEALEPLALLSEEDTVTSAVPDKTYSKESRSHAN